MDYIPIGYDWKRSCLPLRKGDIEDMPSKEYFMKTAALSKMMDKDQ